MPKLKTHSGTKDRVRITKNGKVRHGNSGGNHLLQKKSAARKRRITGLDTLQGSKLINNVKKKLGV